MRHICHVVRGIGDFSTFVSRDSDETAALARLRREEVRTEQILSEPLAAAAERLMRETVARGDCVF